MYIIHLIDNAIEEDQDANDEEEEGDLRIPDYGVRNHREHHHLPDEGSVRGDVPLLVLPMGYG